MSWTERPLGEPVISGDRRMEEDERKGMGKMEDEKFMKMWKKERARGKERYMVYRTLVMSLIFMLGSALGRVLRGGPFTLDGYLFIAGAVGGLIGTSIAWKRSEERYLQLLEDKETVEGAHPSNGAD